MARGLKRVPVSTLRRVVIDQECEMGILVLYSEDGTHVVTYGRTAELCDKAAQAADWWKREMGWPPTAADIPSRVRTLMAENARLKAELEQSNA